VLPPYPPICPIFILYLFWSQPPGRRGAGCLPPSPISFYCFFFFPNDRIENDATAESDYMGIQHCPLEACAALAQRHINSDRVGTHITDGQQTNSLLVSCWRLPCAPASRTCARPAAATWYAKRDAHCYTPTRTMKRDAPSLLGRVLWPHQRHRLPPPQRTLKQRARTRRRPP